ncbi:unnamed protein product [Orchesella dallaii]|uniref:Uncharacterized protein n=1 Tax=Orchesella dallaii TaxID=48710 RepID=A0ABP1R604_9HEXA
MEHLLNSSSLVNHIDPSRNLPIKLQLYSCALRCQKILILQKISRQVDTGFGGTPEYRHKKSDEAKFRKTMNEVICDTYLRYTDEQNKADHIKEQFKLLAKTESAPTSVLARKIEPIDVTRDSAFKNELHYNPSAPILERQVCYAVTTKDGTKLFKACPYEAAWVATAKKHFRFFKEQAGSLTLEFFLYRR